MRREVRGDAGPHVQGRIDLHQIESDHVAALGDGRQSVAQFRVVHPVRLRRYASRYQRQVKHVDVDAHVRPRIARDRLGNAVRPDIVELAYRHHPVAVIDRVTDFRFDAAEAPDPDLGEAQHMLHRSDVTKRMDVGEAQIVDERRIVDVGVEVDDVQRLLVLVRLYDRVGDRVIAAERHRHRPPGKDRPGEIGRIFERALDVGRPDVDVADIRDGLVLHLVFEVGAPGHRIIETGIGGEPQRVLANRTRTHARTGKKRRAFVKGDPENRDLGIESIKAGFDRRTQERGDADERAVQLESGTSTA